MAITKVTNSLVATNAIQGTLIADNAITSVHIAQNQVTAVQIPDGSITSTQIAANSIDTAELVTGSIDTIHIGDSQVTTAKITDLNVTTGKIANNAITAAKIPDGSITETQLSSSAAPTFGNITTTGTLRGPASFTIDPAVVGNNTGTVVIAGDLQVDGNSTTINSSTLLVEDKNITLARTASTASAANTAGISVAGANADLTYFSTGDKWSFNKPLDVVSGTAGTTVATFEGSYSGSGNVKLASFERSGSAVAAAVTYTDATTDMEFGTTTGHSLSLTTGNTRKLTITNAGDVTIAGGIFTTIHDITTVNKFKTTNNNTRSIISMESKDSSGNAVDLRIHALGDGPRGEIYTYTNHPLGFATNNAAPQMTLLTNGNFGIDEDTPATRLHVDKSGGGDLLTLGGGNVTEYVVFVDSNEVRQQVDPDNDEANSLFTWFIDGSRKAIFESHGLHLGGLTAKADLDIKQKGNDWENGILLQHDNANTGWNIHAERQGSSLWFGYNSDTSVALASQAASEVLCLRSSGNVGIGVNDPDTNLEVNIQGGADGNGIHITSTATNNDPTLKISRNGGAADVYSLRPRGGTGSSNYLAIAPGTSLDGGINLKQNGYVGLGGNNAPVSLLHMYGNNTADVASNGAGINGLHLSRTSSRGENIYAYMTDGNAAASSWAGLGNVGKIESFGNNAFEIGTQQDAPVVIGQNNTQKLRIKGDITAHTKFGSTYIESIYTPNGGVQNCRIFEDHLGKWVAVGYFAANAATSIQGTWSSVRGGPTGLGQSETTQFSADWGDSYPTEVRYMGASDFYNFNETKTIDFVHGVPRGRPWKEFFNNAQRRQDATTPHSGTNHMGSVQGPTGTEKYGWECRGAYDGRGRWHNPGYTHHRMSDINSTTHLSCPTAAFTTATSNAFNWNTYLDAKISVHHSLSYSGQDTAGYSAAFGRDDTNIAFFDDYPNSSNNMQSSTNNYGTAVYVLMKLPEMQSIGLEGGRSRDHQPGEIVQTKVYERNSDVSATSGLTGEFGSLAFTPLYGNSLIEFNVHANTGTNSAGSVIWRIYQGSPSVVGTEIRRTGNQIVAAYDQAADGHPLPFSWTQYYQLNDDKKSPYTYRVRFSPSGATYWGHTYGTSAHSYFTIKEIKQEHNATGITD